MGWTSRPPVPDTWKKMLDILLFWAKKGVDGFRCDMAEMVPVEFWTWAIKVVKKEHPEMIFIAEIYNPFEYHSYVKMGGFDFIYDKVGLYDTLKSIITSGSAGKCWRAWMRTCCGFWKTMMKCALPVMLLPVIRRLQFPL